jgi:hypothetical protein
MFVAGLEMRSASRAGDDKTPSKRAGTSETHVISVPRLAPVPSRGAIEWKCRTLGAVVQIHLMKILIQRLSNHLLEEPKTPGLSMTISRRKMNKSMIIEFVFRAMIDFPLIISIGFWNYDFLLYTFSVQFH